MNQPSVKQKNTVAPDAIDAQHILDYLVENPDFLSKHADVLALHAASQAVVDMQPYLVERLKQEMMHHQRVAQNIIQTTQSNLDIQKRTQDAVVRILWAKSFDEFTRIVTQQWADYLGVDGVTLCLEAKSPSFVISEQTGLHFVNKGFGHALFGLDNTTALRPRLQDHIPVFSRKTAKPIKSDALVRLKIGSKPVMGILAFGSYQEGYFQMDQGTESLEFLGRVVEACLARWLLLT